MFARNFEELVIYVSIPTVASWWSQWGVIAASHCHSWCRWWSDTLWHLQDYDQTHSCCVCFHSTGTLNKRCWYITCLHGVSLCNHIICSSLQQDPLSVYQNTVVWGCLYILLLSNPFWACATEDLWWILSCRGLDIFLCCLQNRNGHLWVTSAWCTYLFLWKKNAIWRPWLIFHSNCYLRRVDGSISGVWALKLSVP